MTICERVTELRYSKHLTETQFANQLGMSQATVNRQLKSDFPSLELISKVLSLFPELSAEWLMRGTGSMEIQPTSTDEELRNVCIEQAKEIYQLRNQLARLKEEK